MTCWWMLCLQTGMSCSSHLLRVFLLKKPFCPRVSPRFWPQFLTKAAAVSPFTLPPLVHRGMSRCQKPPPLFLIPPLEKFKIIAAAFVPTCWWFSLSCRSRSEIPAVEARLGEVTHSGGLSRGARARPATSRTQIEETEKPQCFAALTSRTRCCIRVQLNRTCNSGTSWHEILTVQLEPKITSGGTGLHF